MRHHSRASPLRLVPLAAALVAAACLLRPARAHDDHADDNDVTILMPITEHFNPQWCPNTISRQKINPYLASDCPKVLIPPRLCLDCQLRPFNSKGIFAKSQRDIYNTEDPKCKAQLIKYRDANKCDGPRVRDINAFYGLSKGGPNKQKAKKDLGEFMYNVCELCCDCVPIGIKHKAGLDGQFDKRQDADTKATGSNMLVDIHRGNCLVHYYYDTCRMWPKIRNIGNIGDNVPVDGLDEICTDHVYPWWNHPKKYWGGWPRAKYIPIPSARLQNYLRKMMDVLGCRAKEQWVPCTKMEMAQGRV